MEDSDSVNKDRAVDCVCGKPVNNLKKRVRGVTSMSLEWLAERLRKAEKIKEKLAKGTYKVDSNKLAKAILNQNNKKYKIVLKKIF